MEYHGKKVCRVLKDIRKQIADANDIQYSPSECNHKGECAGTCPRCEQEMQYIESELAKKKKLGKKIAIAAVTIGTAIVASTSLSSCVTSGQGKKEGEIYSDMVGQKQTVYYNVKDLDTLSVDTNSVAAASAVTDSLKTDSQPKDSVVITITQEMVGENYEILEPGSAVWKAVEAADAQKKTNKKK